ncbi:TlpA family protein disulfide reductase [Pedosphaera parvula]|uniref:Redoxin domain protein n=1 Tax=Pedosphaera parvula (strain Ellin514) TaxID=320771 RepID=B9XH22_PEDPL|nr:TlpA disulfide reductase family protein [Pedosphaera parvula]EEF60943.1 Redoxin domain protein [Pedosphaera parvula Ellin514]
MRSNPEALPFCQRGIVQLFMLSLLFLSAPIHADTPPVNAELSVLGRQVLKLLQIHDAEQFSTNVAASLQDWRKVQSASTMVTKENPLNPAFEKHLERQRMVIAESARIVLAQAKRLGLDSAQVHFTFKEARSSQAGTTRNPLIQAEGEDLSYLDQAIIVLTAEPAGGVQTNSSLPGQYELCLAHVAKFPGGWRVDQGIRWLRFPAGVADAEMTHELDLLTKIDKHKSISGSDDPAMAALGESIARFIQQKDEKSFISQAIRSRDEIWADFMKTHASEKPAPNRKELEADWQPWRDGITESARGLLAQLDQYGIDFTGAKLSVKRSEVEHAYQYSSFGKLEDTDGYPFKVAFTVESDQKSKTGRPIAGEYVVMAKRTKRTDKRWVLEGDFWWSKFPAGVLDEAQQKELEYENYAQLKGSLPPGADAPNVEFVRVDNQNKLKLSDFHGKVLVLDIWATWCGPCQEPMAKLQLLASKHPEWKGKVEVASLSIDDDLATAQKHLNKRDWTNSFNLWAGPGGYKSIPAKGFRLYGVPTLYVINTEGKVVTAGHPEILQTETLVEMQLNKAKDLTPTPAETH